MLSKCIEICHEGGCIPFHEYYRDKQRPVHHTIVDKSDKISQTDRQTNLAEVLDRADVHFGFLGATWTSEMGAGWSTMG